MKLTPDQLKEIRERAGTRLAAHGFAIPENKDVLELLDHAEELEQAVESEKNKSGMLTDRLQEAGNALNQVLEQTPQEWWNSEAGQDLKGGYLDYVIRDCQTEDLAQSALQWSIERQSKERERILSILLGNGDLVCPASINAIRGITPININAYSTTQIPEEALE